MGKRKSKRRILSGIFKKIRYRRKKPSVPTPQNEQQPVYLNALNYGRVSALSLVAPADQIPAEDQETDHGQA